MSVIVKGMKMPQKGEYLMTLYVDSDGSAYIDVESFPEDKDKFDAIEVPPHGRLIDADALNELIDGGYDLDFDEVPETKRELMRMIDDAPTIIPAEEGE